MNDITAFSLLAAGVLIYFQLLDKMHEQGMNFLAALLSLAIACFTAGYLFDWP